MGFGKPSRFQASKYFFAIVVPLVSLFSIFYFTGFKISMNFWILISVVIIFQISLIISNFFLPGRTGSEGADGWDRSFKGKLVNGLIFPSYIFPIMFLLMIIPSAYYNTKYENIAPKTTKINFQDLESSINSITGSVENLESIISSEKDKIRRNSIFMLKELESKMEDLTFLEEKVIKLEETIKIYETTLDLSKDEVVAIQKSLSNTSKKDFFIQIIIGFILGVLGSLASYIIIKLYDKTKPSERRKAVIRGDNL
jgi:hypothetical protein